MPSTHRIEEQYEKENVNFLQTVRYYRFLFCFFFFELLKESSWLMSRVGVILVGCNSFLFLFLSFFFLLENTADAMDAYIQR